MATHSDWNGVYFTISALRLYHPEVLERCEIIVVDNAPQSADSHEVRNFMGWLKDDKFPARYIAASEAVGTSAPRDRVFREAQGEAVLCLDCHVLVWPRAIRRLIEYYDAHPDCRDLLSGPMVYDDLRTGSTHMADEWREQMWGTWATAWLCPCGQFRFDVSGGKDDAGRSHALYRPIFSPQLNGFVAACPECGKAFPSLPYERHEPALTQADYDRLDLATDREPFPIPAMGLGLFSCRKDAWLGFNERFRGFGGEEWYIHEKYRKAGAQALCVPWLKWVHRFGRPAGVPYPINVWNKVRNYVIGLTEVGLPLDRVREHFVDSGKMPRHDWDQLIADPANPPEMPVQPKVAQSQAASNCGSCGGEFKAPAATLAEWFQQLHGRQHDFAGHEDYLAKLAGEAEHVTELGGRRGSSTVCLLAGKPKTYRLIDPNAGSELPELKRLVEGVTVEHVANRSERAEPAPTDLLAIDTNHHADQLYRELSLYAPHVRRRIVVHDTVLHAEQGENGLPGLLPAIRRFVGEHPEWSVVHHDRSHYGLLTMSRDPADKKALPGVIKQAWNYSKALAVHAATGAKTLPLEMVQSRLAVCDLCESRTDNRCAECGCYLDQGPNGEEGKATWADQDCPLGKWPEVDV